MSLKVGLIGWRGMVGSVLLERMQAEKDFEHFTPTYFSTSQAGQSAAHLPKGSGTLKDANSLEDLQEMDILLSAQGGDYTKAIHPKLRASGWKGFWIDAASTLRMDKDALICLDPLNAQALEKGIETGIKDYIGGNCTVSLMLMGLGGLFKADLVEWTSSMTYQAASGGGAQHMRELLSQMKYLTDHLGETLQDKNGDILELDSKLNSIYLQKDFPKQHFGYPLAGGLLPWIDVPYDNGLVAGQSKEEWKGGVEANKILGKTDLIPMDGTCVRIGAMRCHSQAVTLKLKRKVSLNEARELIHSHNPWVRFVDNNPDDSKAQLNPVAVSGKLHIPVGRVRHMIMGEDYLNVFTVGDQLLWGAAEPLRRMLRMILKK